MPVKTRVASEITEIFVNKTGSGVATGGTESSDVVMAPTGKDGTWGNVVSGGYVYECP